MKNVVVGRSLPVEKESFVSPYYGTLQTVSVSPLGPLCLLNSCPVKIFSLCHSYLVNIVCLSLEEWMDPFWSVVYSNFALSSPGSGSGWWPDP